MQTRPAATSSASPPKCPPYGQLRSLQLGMGWVPEQGGNGLDRMFYGLTQHLPEAGVHVSGWALGSEAVVHDSSGRVRTFASESASLPRRLWGVRRSVQQMNALDSVDLVASHFALYTAPLLDLIDDRPFVVHFHGPWASESAVEGASWLNVRVKKWVEQSVYRQADRFIVLSEAFGNVLTDEFDVDRDRISVVPGGVDVDRFAPTESQRSAREALGLPVDRPIVLTVRRLVQRVGLESLVRAMDRLRNEQPDVLLLVAGQGPLASTLERLIREHNLSDHVHLLGFVPDDDLPTLYRAAQVSIVPSTAWEGFGLVAAESLAAGTPVLVTPVGGLPEVVRPLSPSLVLDDHTPEALARGLGEALQQARPVPTDDECHQYARERFDWPHIAAQTRDVYLEVCQ